MSTSNRQQPRGFAKPLGIWLCLLVLLIGTTTLFVADSERPALNALQVKRLQPVVAPPRRNRTKAETDPAKSPLIRVNVTPGGSPSVKLEIRGPYSIRLVDSAREVTRGDKLAATDVQPTATGLKLGKKTFNATRLEIVPDASPSVRINDHLYRGTMRLFRRSDGTISAVNVLPLEQYLASVIDSEMPAAFPESARQAQAIVSRTYAMYQIEHADPAAVYDLFSSQRSQKYLGVEYTTDSGRRLAGESEASRQAAAMTRGTVCMEQGHVFCTYYSAVCGGQTTNGSEVFTDASALLKSVPCEWCRESEYFRWTTELESRDFLKRVESLGALTRVASVRQLAGPGGGK